MNALHNDLNITICKDALDAAMRGFDYAAGEDHKPIRVIDVVVVQKGTEAGRPTVDFVLQAEDGQKFVFMVTGRLLKAIPC